MVGLEGILAPSQPHPCCGLGTPQQIRLPRTPCVAWDGAPTDFLHNPS